MTQNETEQQERKPARFLPNMSDQLIDDLKTDPEVVGQALVDHISILAIALGGEVPVDSCPQLKALAAMAPRIYDRVPAFLPRVKA